MATSNGDSDDPEPNPATLPGQSPDPTPNDVYADTRGDGDDELLRVMYAGPEAVFLKSELTDRTGRHIHRQEDRSAFDSQVKMGRLSPRPDASPDIPKANVERATSADTEQPGDTGASDSEPMPENNAQIGAFTGDTNANTDTNTKSDTETNTNANTDTTDADSTGDTGDSGVVDSDSGGEETGKNDREDWTAIDNIGVKTAEKMHEAGYTTPESVRQASDDELIEVPYLGEKGIEKLREAVA